MTITDTVAIHALLAVRIAERQAQADDDAVMVDAMQATRRELVAALRDAATVHELEPTPRDSCRPSAWDIGGRPQRESRA